MKDKERYENLARQEMLIIERRKERLLSESVSSSRDFMTLMVSYFVTGLFVAASVRLVGHVCVPVYGSARLNWGHIVSWAQLYKVSLA